jgi:hypothetical protein
MMGLGTGEALQEGFHLIIYIDGASKGNPGRVEKDPYLFELE